MLGPKQEAQAALFYEFSLEERVRTDWFGSERDAKDARFALHMNKAKWGYD